jgi:hypothetical protein
MKLAILIIPLLVLACASSGQDDTVPPRASESSSVVDPEEMGGVPSIRAMNDERARREERARFGPIAQEELGTGLRCSGGLRQVQLLEVNDGPEPRVRFVTVFQCRTAATSHEPGATGSSSQEMSLFALYERPLRSGQRTEPAGVPDRWMTVDHPILPFRTAECRQRWWFLESGSAQRVVTWAEARRQAVVHDFPVGGALTVVDGVLDVLDARAWGERTELLIRTEAGVEHVSTTLNGELVARRVLVEPLAHVVVASFARGASDDTDHVVVAGGADGTTAGAAKVRVAIVDLSLDRTHEVALMNEADLEYEDSSRLAVATSDARLSVALGNTKGGPGRCAGRVIRFSWTLERGLQGEEVLALRNGLQVVEGGWSDAGLMGSDTGHAVTFTTDADGDGAPELLVASPTIVLAPRVDLVSSSSGGAALGCALDDFSGLDFGSSVAVDPTGDYALIGGGYTTRPEDYRKPSAARLIRIRSEGGEPLATLATWTLAAGDLVIERGVPEQLGSHE